MLITMKTGLSQCNEEHWETQYRMHTGSTTDDDISINTNNEDIASLNNIFD